MQRDRVRSLYMYLPAVETGTYLPTYLLREEFRPETVNYSLKISRAHTTDNPNNIVYYRSIFNIEEHDMRDRRGTIAKHTYGSPSALDNL